MEKGTALTLTYKQHYSVDPLTQFITTIGQVCMLLRRSCDHYEIYPEMTVEGNLHYHILCNVKDPIKWYRTVLPRFKRNGFTKIKQLFDIDKWRKYCQKDMLDMMEILRLYEDHSLPITKKNDKYYKKTKVRLDADPHELDGILKWYGLPEKQEEEEDDNIIITPITVLEEKTVD